MNSYYFVNILFVGTLIALIANIYFQLDLFIDYYDVPQEVWDWVSQHQFFEIDNSSTMVLGVVFMFFLALQLILLFFQQIFTFWVESYNQIIVIKIGLITNIGISLFSFLSQMLFNSYASNQILEWGIYQDCTNVEERIYNDQWVDNSIKELCDFVDQGLFNSKYCIYITLVQSFLTVGYIYFLNQFLNNYSGKFEFNNVEFDMQERTYGCAVKQENQTENATPQQ